MYQNKDYFAFSNSFFRLLDHVKYRFPLSLNQDFANQILLNGLASHAFSETAVNEIRLLDKDVVVHIDILEARLRFERIDYKEDTIPLDSLEGIAVLDNWFSKWTSVFRNLKARTNQISLDLSGGFDSRVCFLLMLKSGVNLSEIRVNSIHDELHSHKEDYEIAAEIAKHFAFPLNTDVFSQKALHYSLKDIINIAFYTKMTFHKEMYYKYHRFAEKRYVVAGSGGETRRSYWDESAPRLAEQMAQRVSRYSAAIAQRMSASTYRILQSAYDALDVLYDIKDYNSTKYGLYLYSRTRCRNHFGKCAVENLFSNTYVLTPFLDPDLQKLKLSLPECRDNNLLMALIYVRYCPELLNFRFEGKRSIAPDTIGFARKLNKKFPIKEGIFSPREKESFTVNTTDNQVMKMIENGGNNRPVTAGIPDEYFMEVFNSCGFRKLFATNFDEELYEFAKAAQQKNKYFPLRECYAVIGITKVIEDVALSRQICQPSLIQSLDRFIARNEYEPDNARQMLFELKNYITARIDVKLQGSAAQMKIIGISDTKAKVTKPAWFQNNGLGYVLESYRGFLDLMIRAETAGNLTVAIRGVDVRDKDNNRIPFWIDYQMVSYNGRSVLEKPISVWHDKPYKFSHQVKNGEIVSLRVEWTPHN